MELLRRYSNYQHLVKPLVNLLEEINSAEDHCNKTITVDQGLGGALVDEEPEARTTLRNNATTVRQKQHRLTREEITRLIERYEAGALVKMLAAEFEVERRTVSAILKREGVTLRPRGLNTEQVDEAVKLYSDGWSLASIGDRLGVDHETVRSRLRERGVRMREAWKRSN